MVVAGLSPATLVTVKVNRRHPNLVICASESMSTRCSSSIWPATVRPSDQERIALLLEG